LQKMRRLSDSPPRDKSEMRDLGGNGQTNSYEAKIRRVGVRSQQSFGIVRVESRHWGSATRRGGWRPPRAQASWLHGRQAATDRRCIDVNALKNVGMCSSNGPSIQNNAAGRFPSRESPILVCRPRGVIGLARFRVRLHARLENSPRGDHHGSPRLGLRGRSAVGPRRRGPAAAARRIDWIISWRVAPCSPAAAHRRTRVFDGSLAPQASGYASRCRKHAQQSAARIHPGWSEQHSGLTTSSPWCSRRRP
jgi:hypothetical protein